jgi:hypothetical protein
MYNTEGYECCKKCKERLECFDPEHCEILGKEMAKIASDASTDDACDEVCAMGGAIGQELSGYIKKELREDSYRSRVLRESDKSAYEVVVTATRRFVRVFDANSAKEAEVMALRDIQIDAGFVPDSIQIKSRLIV